MNHPVTLVIGFLFVINIALAYRFLGKPCARKTTSGKCCVFPFIYRGRIYTTCTNKNNNRPWCSTTAIYDINKQWGNCQVLVKPCTRKTTSGKCCVFPFTYRGGIYTTCTNKNNNRPWCSTTDNYDTDKQWGNCQRTSFIGYTPQNAYSNDINTCLFKYWTKYNNPNTAVLDSSVDCKNLGSNFKELCYGLNQVAQFAICYNEAKRIPSFTGHLLQPFAKSSARRTHFKKDSGPYAPTTQAEVDDYKESTQKALYPNFDLPSHHYCAKGHLVPTADYSSTQDEEAALTFILTNAAPQWQKFNAVNWRILEGDIRKYVNAFVRNVYVFTGTGGVAKTPAGAPYMMNSRVTAPQYYWKLICDPVIKEMVIFVGKNFVGSRSITKRQGCRGRNHTEERGVMYCDSYDNINRNTLYSDFNLPDMYQINCPTATRGTFLDPYTNNFT